ncbi:hypothetical protein [Nonomuraea sp. NPDC052265]|uniref:hypothetical protein n=1 Tax=Nonomuraea sp. NPDC052265 TaxID=3364374 RepID=UPI0037C86DCD
MLGSPLEEWEGERRLDVRAHSPELQRHLRGARHTEWSALMAGNVVAVLPLVAAFVLAQRHFVATMSWSGLKG